MENLVHLNERHELQINTATKVIGARLMQHLAIYKDFGKSVTAITITFHRNV